MTTQVLKFPELVSSQKDKFITYNANLRQLEALTVRVLSQANGGPPGTPNEGDAYIVDVLSGAWVGFTLNYVAFFSLGQWTQHEPVKGVHLIDNETESLIWYNGTDWATVSQGLSSSFVLVSGSQPAVAGGQYWIDTSSGSLTITLPASPVANDTIYFADITPNSGRTGTALNNTYTIDRNGQLIEEDADDIVGSYAGLKFKMVFTGLTRGWIVLEG